MMKKILLTSVIVALLSCTIADANDFTSKPVIQFESQRDLKWKTDIYDKIEGNTHAEKAKNALTTWEMQAVSEIELWTFEDNFYALTQKLYQSLEPSKRELFLKTHDAWKTYVVLQARFIAGEQGSAAPLYAQDIMKSEIQRRTQLYQELLDGGTVYTTGLSMYK